LKFEKSSSALEDILNQQISPSDKTGIGYDHKQKHIEEEKSFKLPRKTEERPKSHTNGSKDSNSRVKDHDQSRHDKKASQRSPFQRRPSAPRYQSLFPGYCFSCNNFGHKAIDCKAYARNTQVRNRGIYNNVECYKCHNYGHIARDCRSSMTKPSRPGYKKVWKRKQEKGENKECEQVWYAQNKEQNVITKQKKDTTKVWKKKQQQEERTSMLVQTTLLAQNESSSHIISGPKFVKGMTREMDTCNNRVIPLNNNQTKEENQHPEDIFEENLIREEENVDGSKNKETRLKKMGHEGEDHEVDRKVVVKEKELVLNDGRRMLIRERRQ
jgi:hypothetical protein